MGVIAELWVLKGMEVPISEGNELRPVTVLVQMNVRV